MTLSSATAIAETWATSPRLPPGDEPSIGAEMGCNSPSSAMLAASAGCAPRSARLDDEKRDQDPSHRGVRPYLTMSIAGIGATKVSDIAHEDCVLWLWTTNHHMREAFDLLMPGALNPRPC